MNIKKTFLLSALAVAVSAALTTNTALAETKPTTNNFWWPEQLDLRPLRQHSAESNPMGNAFNYAEEFKNSILRL